MRARAEHRVPLSDAAVGVLEGMRAHSAGAADSLILPGVSGRPLNGTTLISALRRATGTRADVHGFRSRFRTWAAERSGATRDVAELAWPLRVWSAGRWSGVTRAAICSTSGAG